MCWFPGVRAWRDALAYTTILTGVWAGRIQAGGSTGVEPDLDRPECRRVVASSEKGSVRNDSTSRLAKFFMVSKCPSVAFATAARSPFASSDLSPNFRSMRFLLEPREQVAPAHQLAPCVRKLSHSF